MSKISLNMYGPIISDKQIGADILRMIDNKLKTNEPVEIDLSGIKSMATFCSKQIFGGLYLTLGSEQFFEKIKILNASADIKLLIRIGIQNAVEERVNDSNNKV